MRGQKLNQCIFNFPYTYICHCIILFIRLGIKRQRLIFSNKFRKEQQKIQMNIYREQRKKTYWTDLL